MDNNSQKAITISINTLSAIGQWVIEQIIKWINVLQKQIHTNGSRYVSFLPYFPYVIYPPSS